jgi:hypothetical protein
MALTPVESNTVSNLSDVMRFILDVVDDAVDLQAQYTTLGMDGTLTNNDLNAGNFKFTKAQLTAALGVIVALNNALPPSERAKLLLVARQRNLRSH